MDSIEANTNPNQAIQQNHQQVQNLENENDDVNISLDDYIIKKIPLQNTNIKIEIEKIMDKTPNIFPIFENEEEKISLGEFENINMQTNQSNQNTNVENNEERIKYASNSISTHI